MMEIKWEEEFTISVRVEGNTAIISANREGLLSLSNHFVALARENSRSHIHLDEHNSLEDNSAELIIERIE